MTNTPLYKLADEFVAIAMQLADSELPDDVITDTLEGASGEIEIKAWNTSALILQFSGEAAIIKELDHLERKHNGGEPFKARNTEPRRGRPLK